MSKPEDCRDGREPRELILPHFLLAGAPKCGTSSLFHWLDSHPQLVGTTPKEPFFFMDEGHPLSHLDNNYHRRGLSGWARNIKPSSLDFQQAVSETQPRQLYFEATTHLIYQQTALQILPSLPTAPRFLFLVRDPVQRLRSSFAYTRENLGRIRGELGFDEYVELLLSGRQSQLDEHIRHAGSAYVLQRDLQYGEYWRYLEGWLRALGPERMLVVQSERLQAEPRTVMCEIFQFLDVPDEGIVDTMDFTRKNETKAVRFRSLQRRARKLAAYLPPGVAKQRLRDGYLRLQSFRRRPGTALHCSEKTRALLKDHYSESQQQLAEHFPIQLDLWR